MASRGGTDHGTTRRALTQRAVDVVVAAIVLALTWPIRAGAALAVRLTMGPPVLYEDLRAGRGGKPFVLLKFRTMRDLLPGERIPDDDHRRVTRVGRLLRSTSVDELPSVLNVLMGDMSIVGPRPLPVRYVDRYSTRQARRLEVRPGITGWAQVNGRNELGWEERFELDVWYVDHRSLALDARIVARTVGDVVGRKGISHEGHGTMPEFGAVDGSS
jgi:lipopolysaccharide/colanic/teichoic acid biosynthesis glycosyltransferase